MMQRVRIYSSRANAKLQKLQDFSCSSTQLVRWGSVLRYWQSHAAHCHRHKQKTNLIIYYGFSKQQVWQLSRPVIARKSGLAVVRASKLNDLAFFGLHFRQLALASYPAWVTNRVVSVQQVECAYGATRIWSAEPEFGFMQTDYSAPCDPFVHSVLALTTTVHERDHQ